MFFLAINQLLCETTSLLGIWLSNLKLNSLLDLFISGGQPVCAYGELFFGSSHLAITTASEHAPTQEIYRLRVC